MKPSPFRVVLPHLSGALVFLFVMFGVELLIGSLAQERRLQSERRALAYAGSLRAHADRELNKILFLSSGLAAYLSVKSGKLDEQEVMQIFAELKKESPHVRNFGLAIGYTLKYVYPVQGNENVIGLDYRDLPQQWPGVKQVIEGRVGHLVGPINLVQGGKGLIYRKPIYIDGQYWGLLSTVIHLDSFINDAFHEVESPLFDFAVRSKVPTVVALWGDQALFTDPGSTRIAAGEAGASWEYAIKYKGDPIDEQQRWLMHLTALLAAAALGLGLYWLLSHRLELERNAMYDALTGLPNRRLLADRLKHSLARTRRDNNILAVLFIDLNGFKDVNDLHGHKAGDHLLIVVSKRIRDELRASDTVSRLGGDEFVVVLESTDPNHIEQLIARLRLSINKAVLVDNTEVFVKAAIGIATSAVDGEDPENLLALADRRMYLDKQRLKELS